MLARPVLVEIRISVFPVFESPDSMTCAKTEGVKLASNTQNSRVLGKPMGPPSQRTDKTDPGPWNCKQLVTTRTLRIALPQAPVRKAVRLLRIDHEELACQDQETLALPSPEMRPIRSQNQNSAFRNLVGFPNPNTGEPKRIHQWNQGISGDRTGISENIFCRKVVLPCVQRAERG